MGLWVGICHQGCFRTRKWMFFPISLFAPCTSAFDQGDQLLQAHLLFCGSCLFPRWHSIAHVALQNYTVHFFAPPKLQNQTSKKQSADFLRMNFHYLNSFHSSHSLSMSPSLWLPQSLILPQTSAPFMVLRPSNNTTTALCDREIVSHCPRVKNHRKSAHCSKGCASKDNCKISYLRREWKDC